MTYRTIDALQVLNTLEKLEDRIAERFPNAGLVRVCHELGEISRDTIKRVTSISKPNLFIRFSVSAIILAGFVFALYSVHLIRLESYSTELMSLVSGLESVVNLLLIVGAGVFSLTNLETTLKRKEALGALHELRSIIHVIDMHQLTKDPVMIGGARTSSSPDHALSPFELVRYLDYCSEMLSLSGKLAALYAQDLVDRDVIEAASDIEQLATNLSQKVWQKITIVQTSGTVQL